MYIDDFDIPDFTLNITNTFYDKACNQILHLGIKRTGDQSEKFNVMETIKIIKDLLTITKDFLNRLEPGFFLGNELKYLKANIDTYIQMYE